MDVSVIIVNYNTCVLTRQCIDSVFEKTTGVDFEVILVDNGSTDGSREVFSSDSRITYIYSEENLGFGRANNLGFRQAKGGYLFLLNSDTYLENNAVFLLKKVLAEAHADFQNGEIACAGCMLRDAEGNIIHSYGRFPTMTHTFLSATLYPVLWKLHILSAMPTSSNYGYDDMSAAVFDVEYITGADLMVRRSVADELGLFDPDFFMYTEETEMQHRYMRAGYRRVICEAPRIVHLEGASNRQNSPARTTIVLRSNLLYFKKTVSPLRYGVFAFLTKAGHVLTYLLTFPFLSGDTKGKLRHLKDTVRM